MNHLFFLNSLKIYFTVNSITYIRLLIILKLFCTIPKVIAGKYQILS